MNEMTQDHEGEPIEDAEVVTEEPEQHEQPQPKNWSEDEEAEARAFGWKSPDEWTGEKPPGYIDNPQDYIARLNNFTPFRKVREELENSKREFNERTRRLEAMQAQAMEKQRQQYEARMQEIHAGKRRAVEEADTQAYDRWEQQERALGAPPQWPQQQPQDQGPAPEVEQYIQTNDWAKDPILWDFAARSVDANPEIMAKSPGEQLAYAEQKVREYFPHKFEQPKQRQQRQMVDGGGLAGGRQKGAFDKLPAEAKEQFRKFVKEGLFTDDEAGKKEYADGYNEA